MDWYPLTRLYESMVLDHVAQKALKVKLVVKFRMPNFKTDVDWVEPYPIEIQDADAAIKQTAPKKGRIVNQQAWFEAAWKRAQQLWIQHGLPEEDRMSRKDFKQWFIDTAL